jgi:hypothetical protein
MRRFLDTAAEFDRCLLVDDVMPEACFQHDEDITEILTVICESSGSRRPLPESFDMGDAP